MDWAPVVGGLIGSTLGAIAVGLSNWLIERYKAKRTREQAQTQNAFSMGANSHMAEVAFDNLIKFAEAYMAAVSKALLAPIREGKKDAPLEAIDFFKIRQEHALWLSEDIEAALDRFEQNIRAPGRRGYEPSGAPASNQGNVRILIAELRKVLGTEELSALRNELTTRSSGKKPFVNDPG